MWTSTTIIQILPTICRRYFAATNPLVIFNGTTTIRTKIDNTTTATNDSNNLVIANKIASDEAAVEASAYRNY